MYVYICIYIHIYIYIYIFTYLSFLFYFSFRIYFDILQFNAFFLFLQDLNQKYGTISKLPFQSKFVLKLCLAQSTIDNNIAFN